MKHRAGRLRPAGRLLPCTLLLLGCGNDTGTFFAADAAADRSSAEPGPDAASAARPEARAGLASGTPCDAAAQCLAGACTLGACSDWGHAMRIAIDTTATGADIRGAVADFPLLVRLNAKNFSFAEARRDGADVRFVAASGRSLSHEIELWNPEQGVADLWVLVPRIEGDSRDNSVLMYWGNPLATPSSSGPAVFGAFATVLHMTPDPDGLAAHLADSSGSNNNAVVQNPAPTPTRWDSIAGPGLGFDGQSTYVTTATRMISPQRVTLSLWLATTSVARASVVGFTNGLSGNDLEFDRSISMDESGRLSFAVLHLGHLMTVTSLTGYNDGAWHLVVAHFSKAGQYLFVDGEPAADNPASKAVDSYSGSWHLGQEPLAAASAPTTDAAAPPGNYFAGALDELRIATDEPSDDWIKLVHATERPGATAVSYRRVP
jgi:biopolymer transport protein ExbB